jgi:hypothetical protein
MKVAEKRARPNRIELANHYYKDAADFLNKYQLAWYSKELNFQGIKSRRMKVYVDLLMATETLLKAIVSLRSRYDNAGEPLVRELRRFNHCVSALAETALRKLKNADTALELLRRCDDAPVTFRYDFEATSARERDQQIYYATVGNDKWLGDLEQFVSTGVARLGKTLSRRSRIVEGRVIFEEMLSRK